MKNLIAANWKMNPGSQKEAQEIFSKIKSGIGGLKSEVVICPPNLYLSALKGMLLGGPVSPSLGGQNVYFEDKGAFTGEISAIMLKDLGVEYVIIGHSERRKYFGETDEIICKKIKKALDAGLKVIFCIGETAEERDAGKKQDVLKRQIQEGLKDVIDIKGVDVAYEPVWAIGTGKTATPEQAQEVHKFIRDLLKKNYSQEVADSVRIQYGGSVKPENIIELMNKPDVDGALVGGASLKADSFSAIVTKASEVVK